MRRTIVTLVAMMLFALVAGSSTSASSNARRWYWTERKTAAEIYFTDATDRFGRQPGPLILGDGFISDRIDCTGFPPLLRRNGLRMYRLLECSFTIHHYDELTGEEVSDGVWTGRITPAGREDYLARWRKFG